MTRQCEEWPEFPCHESEKQEDGEAPAIGFHRCCNATKCSSHGDPVLNTPCHKCEEPPANLKKGKVRTGKHLTLSTRSIGTFMKDHCLSTLETHACHLPLVHILSKKACGEMQRQGASKLFGTTLSNSRQSSTRKPKVSTSAMAVLCQLKEALWNHAVLDSQPSTMMGSWQQMLLNCLRSWNFTLILQAFPSKMLLQLMRAWTRWLRFCLKAEE
jgi:hypothetical protein